MEETFSVTKSVTSENTELRKNIPAKFWESASKNSAAHPKIALWRIISAGQPCPKPGRNVLHYSVKACLNNHWTRSLISKQKPESFIIPDWKVKTTICWISILLTYRNPFMSRVGWIYSDIFSWKLRLWFESIWIWLRVIENTLKFQNNTYVKESRDHKSFHNRDHSTPSREINLKHYFVCIRHLEHFHWRMRTSCSRPLLTLGASCRYAQRSCFCF